MKLRIYFRAKWRFGDGRSYCQGYGDEKIFCPFHKCQYTQTALETDIGYQVWEILLKLPKPDLPLALDLARNLGFDMDIMSELLPIGIYGMKCGLDNNNLEKSFEKM